MCVVVIFYYNILLKDYLKWRSKHYFLCQLSKLCDNTDEKTNNANGIFASWHLCMKCMWLQNE